MGGVALALMMAVLPSSLHVPITGPGSQAEVAPVPGQANGQTNLSSLGLADSGTVGSGGSAANADGAVPPLPPGGQLLNGIASHGGAAQQARCIGNPPRQTEDPLSPPCLAGWTGSDNGGPTARGVGRSSVSVVLLDRNFGHDDANYTDAPRSNDDPFDLNARALLRFFQSRYVTFGRTVNLYHYRGTGTSTSGNTDLTYSELKQRYNPFAIIEQSTFPAVEGPALADHVLVFQVGERELGGNCQAGQVSMSRMAPYLWCWAPDTDAVQRAYANYVCSGLAGRPASQASGPLKLQTRKFGVLSIGSNSTALADSLKQRCGIVAKTYRYTSADYNTEAATLSADGVTSLLNPDPNLMQPAVRNNYFPEWIWAERELDNPLSLRVNASNASPAELQGVFGIVDVWRWRPNPQPYWYQAVQAAVPGLTPDTTAGSPMYQGLMMAFTAIQRAGANLTARNVQAGLEGMAAADALPWSPRASYSPGDHAYVDDFMIVRWDTSGTAPGASSPGCDRLLDDGRRYLADGPWPSDDRAAASPGPCNAE